MTVNDKWENSFTVTIFSLKLLSFLQDEALCLHVIVILSRLLNFTLQINNKNFEGPKTLKLSDGGEKPWRQMIKLPS